MDLWKIRKNPRDGSATGTNAGRPKSGFHRHTDDGFIHCKSSCRQGDGEVVIPVCVKGVGAEDGFHTHPSASPEKERASAPSRPASKLPAISAPSVWIQYPISGGYCRWIDWIGGSFHLGALRGNFTRRDGSRQRSADAGRNLFPAKYINVTPPRKRQSSPQKWQLNSAREFAGLSVIFTIRSVLKANCAVYVSGF